MWLFFIDLEKTFDTVNHKILCEKLNYYGFRGVSSQLIRSYLENRKQYASINGFDSLTNHINPEGIEIENLFTSLGLSQIISEPTNFEPNKNPSCIDLIATDQHNIILDCGTRVSLDTYCHHQIIYCRVNFKIPPPPPFERIIWHFNRANTAAIKRSMTNFPC